MTASLALSYHEPYQVKVKSRAKTGLPPHGVSRRVSDKAGTGANGVTGSINGFIKGKWRDANGKGDRPRNRISRATRGSSLNQEPGVLRAFMRSLHFTLVR